MAVAKRRTAAKKRAVKKKTPEQLIGARIDALVRKREKIRKMEKQLNDLKEDFEKESLDTRADMLKQKLEGAQGRLATASVGERELASIDDYSKFKRYVLRTKSLDLLQSRVSITAVRERMEDGKAVPGIAIYHKPVLNLRTRSKK